MTTTRVLMTVKQAWSAEKPSEQREEKPAPALRAAAARVAALELRETAPAREQALLHMRAWLRHNADVTNSFCLDYPHEKRLVMLEAYIPDDSFLLRFLRQKKFSTPMAQQTLLKYLNLREYYPEMSRTLDCEEPKMREIISSGYILISPVRDSQGRTVIIYDMGKFDARKFSCWDMARAHVLVYESLLEEQESQVLGFTHVGDAGGAGAAHVAAWNPIHFGRVVKWGEQSIPMRHKEVHIINISSAIKYVVDFACTKLPPKLVNRLHVHSNLKTLHGAVTTACLPAAYGGALAAGELLAHTRRVLEQRRARVLGLDLMRLSSTRGIRSSRDAPGELHALQGSFRKLDID